MHLIPFLSTRDKEKYAIDEPSSLTTAVAVPAG